MLAIQSQTVLSHLKVLVITSTPTLDPKAMSPCLRSRTSTSSKTGTGITHCIYQNILLVHVLL